MDSPRPTETKPATSLDGAREGERGSTHQDNGIAAAGGGPSSPPSGPARPQPSGESLLLAGLRVVMFIWVGIVLVILPWQDRWTQNALLVSHPMLRNFLVSYFTRGAVAGLGVVNLWIAVSEVGRLRR